MISSHGYDDYKKRTEDEKEYEAYVLRKSSQQHTVIHMTQQITAKIVPRWDGYTLFFAFEDVIKTDAILLN